jgi:hypothetical protein
MLNMQRQKFYILDRTNKRESVEGNW